MNEPVAAALDLDHREGRHLGVQPEAITDCRLPFRMHALGVAHVAAARFSSHW